MLNKIFRSVSNGETVKVIEFDDKSKQCIVELENGKTRAYSSATLKDKRKFIPVEAEVEVEVEVERELVPMPGTQDPDWGKKHYEEHSSEEELTDEEYAAIGLEIAEQANVKAEQAKAKKSVRKSLRLKEVTYKGETKSIREWAEETGVRWKTLYNRINNNGWPVDLALETPDGQRRPKDKEA